MTEPVLEPFVPDDARPGGAPPPGYGYLPRLVTRHSRALLVAVAGFALVAAVVMAVGGQGFPSAAPVEQLYCFGLIIDMVAVVITTGTLTAIEFARRGDASLASAALNHRPSVFAIIAVIASVAAFALWASSGGEQLISLAQGLRTRYMYASGGLFVGGIPWGLGLVFGAWGFRPGASRVTNVLAIVAIGLGVVLAVIQMIAAVVYGLGLSD
ncbi:hypothetical protein BH11ACT3_BH11ACT3_02710 [soil metagenome]